MIGAVARKLFGSSNERRIRAYRPRVDDINALEAELEALSDESLRARTDEFKKQLAEGRTLDDILVPAFATVREASKRTLGQRHFDVPAGGDPWSTSISTRAAAGEIATLFRLIRRTGACTANCIRTISGSSGESSKTLRTPLRAAQKVSRKSAITLPHVFGRIGD